jgi:hypothetical protein
MTTKAPSRTAAQMGARLSEIGALLASCGGLPVPDERALIAEREQLRIAYRAQLNAESEKPSAETLRWVKAETERAERLRAALAEAAR